MKKNRWFLRMLLSYLPIFYIVIAIIFLISMVMINENSKKQTLKTNVGFANHVVSILEQSLKSIDSMMIKEIDKNESLQEYLFTSDRVNKYYLADKVSDNLNNIIVNNKLINSIYLYNSEEQTVLSTNISTKADSFGDEGFIQEVKGSLPIGWTNNREYHELEYDKSVEVFSLVKAIPLFTGEKGFIVINVNVQAIKSMLDDISNTEISHINLYDSHGQLIIGSAAEDMSQIKSSYLGWTVGTRIQQSGLMEWESAFSIWWIIFGLCAIILGTLAIMFISFKHSKPIEDISHQIHDYVFKTFGSKGRNHDFHFIKSALNNLIEESNKSQEHLQENLTFRKQKFFQELLKVDHSHEMTNWELELTSLGRTEGYAKLSVFVIEIDNYNEFCLQYHKRDQLLLNFALTSAIKEISQETGIEMWMEWITQQRIGMICFLHEHQVSALPDYWAYIRTWVEDNLKFTVTLGSSEVVSEVDQLHNSFKKSVDALEYKSVIGNNRVIHFEDIDIKEQGEIFDHLLIIRSMCLSLRQGDQKWESIFENLMETLKVKMYSRTEIINLLHYLVYQLYKDINGLPQEGEKLILELNHASETFETIKDVHVKFKAILLRLSEQLNSLRSKTGNGSVVHEVKAYIEKKYANPDLSLSHLSERFKVNSSYLSRLFKEEFNQNFVDFLARVRIEHAKTLLENTECSLQEISERVGYVHYFSFSRVFKKIEGISAGDFRKTNKS